jgi:UrcA family protein
MMKTACIAAAAACAPLPARADAQPAPEAATVELVSYADLDLRFKAAQGELARRVQSAAMHVCTPDGFLVLGCYEGAMADALKQVDEAIATAQSGAE